ncbi:MAG TPA: response regulator [Stellaceae bacterium]|nr:response regulator [Stellaceae bacterium]
MEPLISIVDDDQAVREALQRMLRSYGFTTAVFDSAEQFLASGRPCDESCLILDVRMPGMTGWGLHHHLVSGGCRIPIILITGSPTRGERERAMSMGVVSYLAKPIDERVLLETLREALEHGSQTAD